MLVRQFPVCHFRETKVVLVINTQNRISILILSVVSAISSTFSLTLECIVTYFLFVFVIAGYNAYTENPVNVKASAPMGGGNNAV